MCQVREVSRFDNSILFFTVGRCIEDRHYVLSTTTGVCGARAVLLHTCHSWSGHVLESWCVGEWGCVVVQNFMTPLPLSPVREKFVSSFK